MTLTTLPTQDRMPRRVAVQRRVRSSPPVNSAGVPRALIVVLLVGLALRLAVVAWLYYHGQELYVWDERDYDKLAVNLLRHGEFGFEPGQLTSLRPPVYPLFLAGMYALGGEQNYTLVRIFQALLATATGWMVFVLARSLFDKRTGVVAAGIHAYYPSLVAATGLILTETLFAFFLCAICLLMQQCLSRGGTWRFAALGIVLALGALTRSVLWLFPPVLIAFLLACNSSRIMSRRLLHATIAVATFVAVIAPWAYRNTRLQHTFTAVDVMGGRNFMMGNYEHTPFDRPWDAISVQGEQSWDAILRSSGKVGVGTTQGQLDKLALKYGLNYVCRNPGQTLARDSAKFIHFWQLEREIPAGMNRGYWGDWSRGWVIGASGIIVVSYMLVVIGGVLGWLLRPAESWQMHAFMLLIVAFVCGIHTLVFAHSRYHLPLMPLLAIYAAAVITADRALLTKWRQPTFWLAAIVCLVLAASWSRELMIEVPPLFSLVAQGWGVL